MMAELPGRVIRWWAVLQETVQQWIFPRPSVRYRVESLPADYRRHPEWLSQLLGWGASTRRQHRHTPASLRANPQSIPELPA